MTFDILTLFPQMVSSVLNESIIGRAQKAGCMEIHAHQIRDYSKDKHHHVDDTPAGGGCGMIMQPGPIYDCFLDATKSYPKEQVHTIYLSPKGRVFNQTIAKELLQYEHLVLLCGHYEGVDQRVLDTIVDEELSIGDYVLTGGELPACIIVDTVSRMLDGVLSSAECYEGESIASGLLEYPQYTRPTTWLNQDIPPVLLSGNHEKINEWRLNQSLEITKIRRPDLYEEYIKTNPIKEKKKKEFSIRQIEPKDNKKLEKIIRDCLIEAKCNSDGFAWCDEFLSHLSDAYKKQDTIYFVAFNQDGELVGGCGIGEYDLETRVCELQKMYLVPSAKGTGLSQTLLNKCLSFAKKHYSKVYLETFHTMERAIHFYEKSGFVKLDKPLLQSEHYSCDAWYIKDL